MANSATIAGNISASLDGFNYSFSQSSPAQIAVAGNKRSDNIQAIDTTGAALAVGSCASVGALAATVLAGTAAATVSFYRDAGFTQPIASTVAQGQLGFILVNPPTIYAKASAGSVNVRVFAVEQ